MTNYQRRAGLPEQLADLAKRLYTVERALQEAELTPQLAGKAVVAVSASNTGTVTIGFPVGTFDAPPAVAVTPHGSNYVGQLGTITATSAVLRVSHVNGTSATINVDVDWIAVQVAE